MVRVIHGGNEVHLAPGHTIGSMRKSLREVLNLSDEALALVNGGQAPPDFILDQGDNLEFVAPTARRAWGRSGPAQSSASSSG